MPIMDKQRIRALIIYRWLWWSRRVGWLQTSTAPARTVWNQNAASGGSIFSELEARALMTTSGSADLRLWMKVIFAVSEKIWKPLRIVLWRPPPFQLARLPRSFEPSSSYRDQKMISRNHMSVASQVGLQKFLENLVLQMRPGCSVIILPVAPPGSHAVKNSQRWRSLAFIHPWLSVVLVECEGNAVFRAASAGHCRHGSY